MIMIALIYSLMGEIIQETIIGGIAMTLFIFTPVMAMIAHDISMENFKKKELKHEIS